MFVFDDILDSQNGSLADVIVDFGKGSDVIDISGLYGNYTFVGNGDFTGTKREVKFVVSGDDTIVRIDSNKDGASDMKIVLENFTGLVESDFIL